MHSGRLPVQWVMSAARVYLLFPPNRLCPLVMSACLYTLFHFFQFAARLYTLFVYKPCTHAIYPSHTHNAVCNPASGWSRLAGAVKHR
jgi:hypothetical protein